MFIIIIIILRVQCNVTDIGEVTEDISLLSVQTIAV